MLLSEKTPRESFLIRDAILRRHGFKSYVDFLNSKYWESLKKKALDSKHKSNYDHCHCCASKNSLQLHHQDYRWILTKHELRSVISLCKNCHSGIHKIAYERDVNFKIAKTLWEEELRKYFA